MTVIRTYAGKVMDAFLDVYGMAYGRKSDAQEWEAMLQDYCGSPLLSAAPIQDLGCRPLHLQVKMAMHSFSVWQQHQQLLSSLVHTILRVAMLDVDLQPIRRYQEDRKLLNAALRKYGRHEHLRALTRARQRSSEVLKACSRAAQHAGVEALMQSQHGRQARQWSASMRAVMFEQFLVAYEPGKVTWDGFCQPWKANPAKFLFGLQPLSST